MMFWGKYTSVYDLQDHGVSVVSLVFLEEVILIQEQMDEIVLRGNVISLRGVFQILRNTPGD